MMDVFIGCSGWNYKDWKGKFYPEDLPQKKWLQYYMEHFNTVEINNTFYRTPRDSTVEKWKKQAYGKDFNFTLKGNRYVTQMKKLNDVEESVRKFDHTSELMKTKLACVLWQLPPSLHRDDEKLEKFCKIIKGKNVIEFRHESWFDEEVYEILRKHRVSFCSISTPNFPEEIITTTNTVYLRMHGKGKRWYDYDYSSAELKEWHEKIKDSNAKEVYIYFNNDMKAVAPENAKQMIQLFGKQLVNYLN